MKIALLPLVGQASCLSLVLFGLWTVDCGLWTAAHAAVSTPPPPKATQAEVNAGIVRTKYVAPDTLAGYSLQQSTGGVSAALSTNIAAYQAFLATNLIPALATNAALTTIAGSDTAAAIVIDPQGGGSDATGARYLRPYATTYALSNLLDGDTVILRGNITNATQNTTYNPRFHFPSRKRITVIAYGSWLQFTGFGHGITASNMSNFKWFGGTISGTPTNNAANAYLLTAAFGFQGTNDGVSFDGVTVRDWPNQGISMVLGGAPYSTSDGSVENCRFFNIGTTNAGTDLPQPDGMAVSCFFGHNFRINNNWFSNVVGGAEFENAGYASQPDYFGHFEFKGNMFDELLLSGAFYIARAGTPNNIIIKDNILRFSRDRAFGDAGGISVSGGTNVVISGNIFDSHNTTSPSINITPAETTDYIYNLTVEGNTFTRSTNVHIVIASFITNSHISHAVVRKNISDASSQFLISGANTVVVEENTLRNANYAGGHFPLIALINGLGDVTGGSYFGACSNAVVRNNFLISEHVNGVDATTWVGASGNLPLPKVVFQGNVDNVPILPGKLFFAGGFGTATTITDLTLDHSGNGSPEGQVYAGKGSIWRRKDGSTSTTLYVKESASSTTGWVAVAPGSGSGTFDWAALTNKPPPILLLATNNASSLTNFEATLEALRNLNTTAGVVVQTGTDTFTKRTITGTANEVEVADGDGVAGNPTIGLADPLTIATVNAQIAYFTNGVYVLTNGVGTVVDFFKQDGTTNLASHITFTGITNFQHGLANQKIIHLIPNGTYTITFPAQWKDTYGGTTYTTTNGVQTDLLITCQVGLFTNITKLDYY